MRFHELFRIILGALLGIICYLGDRLVEYETESGLKKALCDSSTHAIVGLMSATIFVLQINQRIETDEKIRLVFVCSLLSSLIDIDHFIEAKSFKLFEATKLRHRPFLHSSTIPFTIFVFLWIFRNDISLRYCLWISIVFCAFTSHHIRDSTRRGLWFWPFGHTNPLPCLLYIILTQLLPFCLAFFINRIKSTHVSLLLDV